MTWFIVQLLPSWVFLMISILGFLVFLLTNFLRLIPIPAVYAYKIPIQFVSVVVMMVGTFLYGSGHNNDFWLAKVEQLEQQVKIAEEKSNQTNVVIEEKIIYRDRVIKEKGQEIIKYVDREILKVEEVVKFVENCPIPKEIIDAHNAAAMLNEAAKGNKK
jgi:energy-coupling factor transporter transmembrane protein EcfT